MSERQLLFLFHPPSGRRIRVEVPTVFGRSHQLHVYSPDERRFSPEDALRLAKLDWVEISGDLKVSRTHGVLDPAGPVVRDLNSANGVYVNGRAIERAPGREGPPHRLQRGDTLTVGELQFVVEIDRAAEQTLNEWLALDRHAFLAPADALEVASLDAFLSERKRFHTRSRLTYTELEAELEAMAEGPSERLGIVVLALSASPEGPWLRVGRSREQGGAGEQLLDMAGVVATLAALPGTKVLALQAAGDPATCEQAFRDHAFQDMVLVTSTVPSHAGLLDPVEDAMCTPPVPRLAASVAGRGALLGAYHAVLDGLDGLIRPDSNVLDQSWLDGYEGALRVVVGGRLHTDPGQVEVSYLPRLQEGTGTLGSFRVRHCFDSARDGSSRVPASALAASWRDDLSRRAAPPDRDERPRGVLVSAFSGPGLLELLQFLVAARNTGRVTVGSPELSGHLVLLEGRVRAASTNLGQRDQAALEAVLALRKGKYEFVSGLPEGFTPEVDLDLEGLLRPAGA